MTIKTQGAQLFGAWLDALHVTNTQCARWLGVSKQVVGQWRAGISVPGEVLRAVLEEISDGRIEVEAWWTVADWAAYDAALKRFQEWQRLQR